MKKAAFLAFVFLVLSSFFCAAGCSGDGGAPPASQPKQAAETAIGAGKITFLELGSVGCKPCEAMVPVMDAVREKFGSKVEVVFHNVRKDPETAAKWRVSLIPTQVFLDREGKEYFRHEGYLPLDEVEKALRKGGLN